MVATLLWEKQAPEMESYSSSAGRGPVVLSGFWFFTFLFSLCWVFIAACRFSCPMVYGISVH